MYEGQDPELRVAVWELVANTAIEQPISVSGTLPYLIQDVDGAELFALLMFLRIQEHLCNTSRTAALSNQALTSEDAGPLKQAHRHGQTCGATPGTKFMLGAAEATVSPCARCKHTPPSRQLAPLLPLRKMGWPRSGRCSFQAGSAGTPRSGMHQSCEALGQPGRLVHGSLDCACRLCAAAT